MTPQEQAIHNDRQKDYGAWRQNMIGTSQQFAGLLTQMFSTGTASIDKNGKVTLADWAAPLFLSIAVKGNRIAGGHFKADNFEDTGVYLMEFVRKMQEEA